MMLGGWKRIGEFIVGFGVVVVLQRCEFLLKRVVWGAAAVVRFWCREEEGDRGSGGEEGLLYRRRKRVVSVRFVSLFSSGKKVGGKSGGLRCGFCLVLFCFWRSLDGSYV